MSKLVLSVACGALAVAGVGVLVKASPSAIADAITPHEVQIVNDDTMPVPTKVTNVPDVHVTNQVDVIPVADSEIVTYTMETVPLNQDFITVVDFGKLVTAVDERLIIDYVSLDAAVGANQRVWASLLPCTEKGNFGRVGLPLEYGGSVYSSNVKVNDAFLATVAMHAYVDPNCTTVVKMFRGPTAGGGHVHVTIHGHQIKRYVRANGK